MLRDTECDFTRVDSADYCDTAGTQFARSDTRDLEVGHGNH